MQYGFVIARAGQEGQCLVAAGNDLAAFAIGSGVALSFPFANVFVTWTRGPAPYSQMFYCSLAVTDKYGSPIQIIDGESRGVCIPFGFSRAVRDIIMRELIFVPDNLLPSHFAKSISALMPEATRWHFAQVDSEGFASVVGFDPARAAAGLPIDIQRKRKEMVASERR